MADREAKIKFKAETEEFQSQIKAANSEMSSLRSEMKLNEAQFQNSGDKAEYLENKANLLESQLEANREKQEALNSEIEVATSIYGEDSQEVANLEKQLNYTMVQEEQLEAQLAATTSEIEANDSATGQLTSTIDAQEEELKALKEEYVNAALTYGENSEEAQRLAGEIESLSGELQSNKQQLADARSAADEYDKSIEAAGTDTASSVEAMADALANAGVAAAIAEIGEAAIDMASEFDDATAVIVEGTGATGEALEELKDAAIDSFGNMKNADADLNDVAGVIAELNTRLGLTGEEATVTADKFLKFSQHVGTDGVSSVDSIVDVMKRWNLEGEDLDGLLDDLTTSNQSCSMSVDEMTGYLTKNSVQFQELGFSLEDSIAFMTSLSDGGANTSVVMAGLTKTVTNLSSVTDDVPGAFNDAIAAIEDCDSVSEALNAQVGDTGKTVEEVFGKKAAQEIATCVQSGNFDIARFSEALQDNQGVMEQTAEGATTMGDEMSRVTNNVAATFDTIFAPAISDVIGFLADLTGDIGQVIRDCPILQGIIVGVATALGMLAAALGITSLIRAVTAAFALLNTTMLANPIFLVVTAIAALVAALVWAYNNCEEFRNAVDEAFADVQAAISEAIEAAMPYIEQIVDFLVNEVMPVVAQVLSVVVDALGQILSVVASVMPNILGIISGVLETIKGLFDVVFGLIVGITTGDFSQMQAGIDSIMHGIQTIISNVLAAIQQIFGAVLDALLQTASNIWNNIRNAISSAINSAYSVVSGVVSAISSTVSSVFNSVLQTASNIWNGIRNGISSAINSAYSVVSGVVSAISSTVSSVFSGIQSTASSIWNGIKNAITSPIETAKGIVQSAINTISNIICGARLELPKIKLPHFNIDGGEVPWGIGGKGYPPSISIDWYAHGGILTSPTIFGWSGGKLLGGGEAGHEAVLPIDTLQTYIDAAFQRNIGDLGVEQIVGAIERLDRGLGKKIADNAPDSYPGDRSFRVALRKAGVTV